MKARGVGPETLDSRPVIGFTNIWSELTPSNRRLRDRADHVKRGVVMASRFPLEFPVTSFGEPLMWPITMMFRNLASMDVEETNRGNPIDGVILLAGCDKTTQVLVMDAARCTMSAILVSGGPQLKDLYVAMAGVSRVSAFAPSGYDWNATKVGMRCTGSLSTSKANPSLWPI